MNELLTQIQDVYAAFSIDAALQIEKNNKAAGTRARKASLELEKLMKEFRKLSLEESKKYFLLFWLSLLAVAGCRFVKSRLLLLF